MNEVNINSGALWEGLGDAERQVVMQVIAEWEKVKIRKRLEELRREILDKMNEFYGLADWQKMNDLMEQLNDTYN
jgi:TRAP-type C4-dicarboxylate transport system substrate-binding protein